MVAPSCGIGARARRSGEGAVCLHELTSQDEPANRQLWHTTSPSLSGEPSEPTLRAFVLRPFVLCSLALLQHADVTARGPEDGSRLPAPQRAC